MHDEAVKCIDKSLEINSNNTDAWNNRGRALAQQERWEEAIYYYDKAISKRKKDEKAPEHVAALNNKGISLAQIANYNNNELKRTESDKCYDRALATDSKFVKALNNKSMLYLDRGDAESAERLIND